MYNLKQLERTASKIERLADIYEPLVVLSRSPLPVTHAENRDFGPVREGYEWGGDFVYANFECTLPDLPRPLWLECDTDGVEHLIFADGKPLDMTDWGAARSARRPSGCTVSSAWKKFPRARTCAWRPMPGTRCTEPCPMTQRSRSVGRNTAKGASFTGFTP